MMGFVKKIFKLKDSVAMVAAILLLTKLLGFVKFRAVAMFFGASRELDIFWAAFLIPDTLFNILVAGSINAAIIPVFSDVLYKDGERRLVRLMSATILLLGTTFIILSAILFVFSEELSRFIVSSGYIGSAFDISNTLNEEDVYLLSSLMRLMLLSPILLGVSSVVTAFLQVHKRFFITTLAPFLYNLGMIVGTYLFVGKGGLRSDGLAWAVVLGSVLHLLVQLPVVYKFIRVHLRIKDIGGVNGRVKFYVNEIYKMATLAVPRIIAYVGEQFNVIINTIISFSLTAGALSAYRYAISLHLFPVHIFGGAIAQVALPNFAEAYSKGDFEKLRALFIDALRKTLFVIFPSVAVLIILRLPIVRLAYGTGQFDWWDTVVTSWALALLGFAIVGQAVVALTLRALYAVHETRWPLVATIITVVVNIIGSYYFTNFFSHYQDWRPIIAQVTAQLSEGFASGGAESAIGVVGSLWDDLGKWFTTRNVYDASVGGLSLSLSVAFLVEMILDLHFLNRKIQFLSWKKVTLPLLKMFLNTVVMAGFMYFVFRLTDFSLDTTRTVYLIAVLLSTTMFGGMVYILISFATEVEEVNQVGKYLALTVKKIERFVRNR